jgi:hypothetical protein
MKDRFRAKARALFHGEVGQIKAGPGQKVQRYVRKVYGSPEASADIRCDTALIALDVK